MPMRRSAFFFLLLLLLVALPAPATSAPSPPTGDPLKPEPFPFSDRYPAEVDLGGRLALLVLTQSGVDVGDVRPQDPGRRFAGSDEPFEPLVATVYVNSDEAARLLAQGLATRPIANSSLRAFRRYGPGTHSPESWPTFSAFVTRMQGIADAYPQIVRLYSIGQSVQGRPIWMLKITDHPDDAEDEPEVRYSSTVHGNEAVGTELILRLAELLTGSYGTDPDLTALVDEMEIWLCPIHNPDGYVSGSRYNAHGVDLNRDFPDRITDPADDPTGREPETQAFMNLEYQRRFVMGVNYHTGARVVNYPWDSVPATPDYAPDDTPFHEYSVGYAVRNPMIWSGGFPSGVTRGWQWYIIRGGMQDWAYHWHDEHHVTIELSDMQPPPYDQMDGYWTANRDAMIWWIGRALEGVRGRVTNATTGAPLQAQIAVAPPGKQTWTDPLVGDYHRLLLPGSYTLTASASGYQTQAAPVTVPGEGAALADFALYPLLSWTVEGTVTELGTGRPVSATVAFVGTGFVTRTNPLDGSYRARLVQGSYIMRISATGYQSVDRPIVLDHDQVQNFGLVGIPCTLLVDDDEGESYQSYYQGGLNAAGVPYEVWSVATRGAPGAKELANYGRAVWFTGDDFDTTLTASDRTALAAYLDSGGRLLITGQDVGFDIHTDAFYANYLHAAYMQDDANDTTLTGLDLMTGLNLVIAGGDGAGNQDYPSQIDPVGGAVPIFEYGPAIYAGLAFAASPDQNDGYRVIYLGFGIEGINNAADRATALTRALVWLGGCPGDDPALPSVSLSVAGSADRMGAAGQTVAYALEVSNSGNATDTFRITLSGHDWATAVIPTQTAVLAPGESAALDLLVEVPGAPAVRDTVTARATSGRDSSVFAEKMLTTTRAYRALSAGNSQVCGPTGTAVDHTFTITNGGTLSDSYAFALWSGDWPATLLGPQNLTLEPGQTGQVVVRVQVPGQPGARGVVASDRFTLTTASVFSPSIAAVSIGTSFATADLGLDLAAGETHQWGKAGQIVTYRLAVTNTGSSTDTFALSLQGQSWPTSINVSQTPPLAPSDGCQFQVQVTLPAEGGAHADSVWVRAASGWNPAVSRELALSTDRFWELFLPLVVR